MLDKAAVKEIASITGKNGYSVSLYLNVDPMFNKKGDYMVHFKNMTKSAIETLDKAVYKTVKGDLEKIENYVLSNKRMFKKGLILFSSRDNSFWREYHLGIPVRNELIVDKTPYTNPLMTVLDNYEKYGILLVDKESARIFLVHLGEIVEYSEIHTAEIPGKHKKGGWFALSQNHYERHIDFHVGLHLKDVIDRLDIFLNSKDVKRLIIGGSDEAVSMVKSRLHKTIVEKMIGQVKVEMFAKTDEVMKRVEPVVTAFEKRQSDEAVEFLVTKTLKNEGAVLGLDNVMNALQEQRVMKLIILKGYRSNGFNCKTCGFLTAQKIEPCPYCKGEIEPVDYIVSLAGEKAIQQGALVEVVAENKKLQDAGGIGAFLRF